MHQAGRKMDQVYSDTKDLAKETYEPPRRLIPTFDVSEQNSKQRLRQKSFSGTQVLLIVAVTIFVTSSIVFMVMYFRGESEGKSKPCVCQKSNITNANNDNVEKKCSPCDCRNVLNANIKNTTRNLTVPGKCKPCDYQKIIENINYISRNRTEEKCKPCVCQNCSRVTSSSKSKNDPTENAQLCPIGCVNSTIRKLKEEKCKPCVCQNCSLVANISKSKNDLTENGECPVGCVNSTMRKFNEEKSKPCSICQNCSLVTNSCGKSKIDSSENRQCPVGCVNSTMRKFKEKKSKPCSVCQNCSLVTNSCGKSKINSTENRQCPVGCVNSTLRKFNGGKCKDYQKILATIKNTSRNHTEKKCKPCVCQNCSLVTNCTTSKINSTENGQCPVGCVRNSTIRGKFKDTSRAGKKTLTSINRHSNIIKHAWVYTDLTGVNIILD